MFKIIGGDGRQYGPVSVEQVRQWLTEGRANLQTLGQPDGGTDWKPLGQYPEFGSTTPPILSAPASTPPPPPTPPSSIVPVHPPVHTYLVPAILCTIFCCMPFGIVGIVYAAQVSSKLQAGDVAGARLVSGKAKSWCRASALAWLLMVLLWMLFFIGGGVFRFHRWHGMYN